MHEPGHLRGAFHEALRAYVLGNAAGLNEDLFRDESAQCRWLSMGAEQRLMWIAGKLWRCTDVMPSEPRELLDMQAESTYAQAARRVRRGLVLL